MELLLLSDNVSHVSKYYHYLDELISIRRSTASVLRRNEDAETVDLKSMMPKHNVKTVELSYEGRKKRKPSGSTATMRGTFQPSN